MSSLPRCFYQPDASKIFTFLTQHSLSPSPLIKSFHLPPHALNFPVEFSYTFSLKSHQIRYFFDMIHPEGLEVRAVCLDASRQNARVEETNVTRNGKEMTCTLSTDPDVLLGFMVRVQDHFRFHSVKSISSRLNMQLPGRPHNAAQPQAAIAFPDNKQELHQGFQLTGILGKGCEHWVRVDDDGNPSKYYHFQNAYIANPIEIKTHTYNAANGIMTEGTKNLDHVLVIVKGCRLPVVRGSGSLTHQQYRTNYLHDDCNRSVAPPQF